MSAIAEPDKLALINKAKIMQKIDNRRLLMLINHL